MAKTQLDSSPKLKLNLINLKEVKLLMSYVKPYRIKFFLGLLSIVLSAFSTSIFPFLLGKMIDTGNQSNTNPSSFNTIQNIVPANSFSFNWSLNTILLLIFLQLSFQTIFSYLRVYLLTEVGEKALADLRKDVFKKLISMPMQFFSERRVGELNSRISADLSTMQDAVSLMFAELLRGFFTLLIGLFFIFWISSKLALIMLSIVPLVAIVAVFFGFKIKKMSQNTQDKLASSNIIVQESLQGISVVKSFTNEFFEIQRYTSSIYQSVNLAIKNGRFRGAFISFMIFSVFGVIAFVMWYGVRMVQQHELTTGALTTFVIFSAFVGGTLAGFAELFSQLQKTLGASHAVREILKSNSEEVQMNQIVIPKENLFLGNIRFENISFAYPLNLERRILKNISFEVNHGEQLAIVGHSGSGKSTIAALLLGFYDSQKGSIFFDKQVLTAIPKSYLRKQIAYVSQDVFLFGGTIRENIAYGLPDATEEEIYSAAKRAYADEFINQCPLGYDTIVGERGIKLSGGQKQRIAIARAIIKNPSILILDEATSALDSESEYYVQKALDDVMKGRTSIIIAHRLSTIKKVDKIIILEDGYIIEQGKNEELLKNPQSAYNKLLESQERSQSIRLKEMPA